MKIFGKDLAGPPLPRSTNTEDSFPSLFFLFFLCSLLFLSDPKFVQMIKDQDFNSWLYFNMYTIFLRFIVLSNWANSRFAKSFVSGPILSFWPKAHGENYFNLKSIIKI